MVTDRFGVPWTIVCTRIESAVSPRPPSRSCRATTVPIMISAGGLTPWTSARVGRRLQGADDRPLLRLGRLLDDGRRRVGAHPVVDQLRADDRQGADAHVDDDRLARPRQRRPVEIDDAVAALRAQMAGREDESRRVIAVRERNPCAGGGPLGRADAGDHHERDAVRCQRLGLLAAAAEDVRIAALEPQHRAAALGQANQQIDDRALFQRVVPRLLADVDAIGRPRQQLEHVLADQMVVEDEVGGAQGLGGLDRQQLGVARTGADERDQRRTHAPRELQRFVQQTHRILPIGARHAMHRL